jgi:hypothetical protein
MKYDVIGFELFVAPHATIIDHQSSARNNCRQEGIAAAVIVSLLTS